MTTSRTPFFLYLIVFFSVTASAQYITVDENSTAQQLVENVLINNPCITISNVSVNGNPQGAGGSYGYFTSGTSSFPFSDGIILSTGLAASAIGPNSGIVSQGATSWGGDIDLEQALGVGNSINATVLEFDFLPLAGKISFDYIFSSEQYLSSPSANQCSFTDGFAFLLKEANSNEQYQNLAIIPGTLTPVKVNTVRGPGTICPAANEQYFDAFNGFEHPTNFNGQTVIMTAQANVIPGTLYHIKLVVADQGNNLYDSAIFLGGGTFKIEKDLGPDRLIATQNPICFGESLAIDATEPGTNNTYEWYRNAVLQAETGPIYTITQDGTYSVEITVNNSTCKIPGEIEVEYTTQLNPNQATIVQCDEDGDGTTIFDLSKADNVIRANDASLLQPEYYENQTDVVPITNPNAYVSTAPKTIYARVQNSFRCTTFTEVFLQISNQSVATPAPFETCDGDAIQDGLYQFDLSTEVTPEILSTLPSGLIVNYYADEANALTETNQLPNIFPNTIPFQEIIWARIINGSDCYGLIPITLQINTFTAPDFKDKEVFLCENSTIDLTVASGYSSYAWDDINQNTTQTLRVDAPGTYSVTVTDANGCEDTKKFIVTPSGVATITAIDINDFRGSKNTVEISFDGIGDYEFSLDGQIYQDSAIFTNIASGEYTVYVKDKNRCGIATQEIFVLDYPLYFTPNGDGQNDVWRISFLQFYPLSKVTIFDRYGKIVYSFNGAGKGWDGKLNGEQLPSTDYWFVIALTDGRLIKGHFALKR